MQRDQLSAVGFAILAMLIYSTPPVVIRALSVAIPPVSLSFSRWLVGAVVLLPFVWRRLPEEWPKLREHRRWLLLISLFMVAGSTLSTIAVYFTTATNAVLVNASQPALTACAAYLVTRERLTTIQALGVACAFAGIVVMITRADVSVLASMDIAVGDIIMLGAVLGWSLYSVFLRRSKYVPSGDILLFVIGTVGTIVIFPIFLVELFFVGGYEMRPVFAVAILYLVLFPTLLATYSWNRSIHTLGVNRASIFINLIPVFGAGLAGFFLGEQLYLYHVAGAILVFFGIVLSTRHR